jgi:hypothetical protein
MGRVPRARPRPREGGCCATPLLVDLRNIYPAEEAARAGFTLVGVGKSHREVPPA